MSLRANVSPVFQRMIGMRQWLLKYGSVLAALPCLALCTSLLYHAHKPCPALPCTQDLNGSPAPVQDGGEEHTEQVCVKFANQKGYVCYMCAACQPISKLTQGMLKRHAVLDSAFQAGQEEHLQAEGVSSIPVGISACMHLRCRTHVAIMMSMRCLYRLQRTTLKGAIHRQHW